MSAAEEEYESLRAQRKQVMVYLSRLNQSGNKGDDFVDNAADLEQGSHIVDSGLESAIPLQTLDLTKGSSSPPLEKSEEKKRAPVIVIDSDDDDNNSHENRSSQALCPIDQASDFRGWVRGSLNSRSKDRLKVQRSTDNQLIPYEQHRSHLFPEPPSKAVWQPSIQFEKVVLQKVTEEERDLHRMMASKRENQPQMQVTVTCEHNGKGKGRTRERTLHDGQISATELNVNKRTTQGFPMPISTKAPNNKKSTEEGYPVPISTEAPNHKKRKTGEHKYFSPKPVQEYALSDINKPLEPEVPQIDSLEDLWKDMSLAMEYLKTDVDDKFDEQELIEDEEGCNHSFVLHDDMGLVCCVCGVIRKKIEMIFDYQWKKSKRSSDSFFELRSKRAEDDVNYDAVNDLEDDFVAGEIFVHPRHSKQMKPHQSEGFKFLVKNLMADNPGGCVLAHAPGSGKTFMLISFIQSFLAKYPSARPLVVLPKGILPTWKKEFQRWQVEDIPLYDFYSVKAEKRSEQLAVLKSWQENKSVLFLGYKQFSTIVCGGIDSKEATACEERLLKVPSLLILDEGHTPRNEDTNILDSLAKVQTPRKVVLSGTLFQNHVREVFNIFNLVRPKFLKQDSSRTTVKRILSQATISAGKRLSNGATVSLFYDIVEDTLQNDDNLSRKNVIKNLRELTKNILHYYKGDFLDELPGLLDFTVLLKLSGSQKDAVHKLRNYEKFKKNAIGTAVYMHPCLFDVAETAGMDRIMAFSNEKIDHLIESTSVREGVKTKFFLNLLSLSESAGEKLLAFSQYILPLKYLERLLARTKGWHVGREIFVISGDSSSDSREWSMDQFNNSSEAKVLFGSIKACGEGISLVGASRVVILDVHPNPSVTRQAIGRAFRPGQQKKVYIYRLVAADTLEEKFHKTSFTKELISKMWFESSDTDCSNRDFQLNEVDIESCNDLFLTNSPLLCQDIKLLYRR